MNNDEPPVTFPVISPQDYETDAEFVNMYKYLTTDELTGNARADKATLIMGDKYTIQNDLLYRMDLPRQKKPYSPPSVSGAGARPPYWVRPLTRHLG